jgi:hypothetical protein
VAMYELKMAGWICKELIEISVYWQRVENALIYTLLRSSDMVGDETKWLDGRCKELR